MLDPTRPAADCPDCSAGSRRDFVRSVASAAVAGGLLGRFAPAVRAGFPTADQKGMNRPAETAAVRLYQSLSDDQKKVVCFPFDHELRRKIHANWQITKPSVDEFFKPEQQKLIEDVFRGVTSPDGFERFQKQMDEDYGGLGSYHVALFGEPGSGRFEFEMTGRHLTIRADGDSTDGTAFGGPIIYGHGAGDSEKGLPGNVFYHQTRKANEVFLALDGKQRDQALLPRSPSESDVPIQGTAGKFPGIAASEFSSDQKELLESVIKVVLAPYRESDVAEALDLLKQGGGLDKLHLAFYKDEDVGNDQEWDVWRLEGPTWVWHFRGAPHVHAYVNIGKKV